MKLDPTIIASLVALIGVLIGWGLGHLTQLALARRQDARDLANNRRNLYTIFLTAARDAMNHLAEGSLNRINGAVAKGAYSGSFFEDHANLQASISGMELISSEKVLNLCRKFGELQWAFANDETNADPVDRSQLDPKEFEQLGASIMAKMKEIGDTYNAFIAAVRKELNVPPLKSTNDQDDG